MIPTEQLRALLKDMEDHARIKRLGSKLAQYCTRLKGAISKLDALASPSPAQGGAFDARKLVDRINKLSFMDSEGAGPLIYRNEVNKVIRRYAAAQAAASQGAGTVSLSEEQVRQILIQTRYDEGYGSAARVAEAINALLRQPASAPAKAPYKGPISQPCSVCSAGDTAMEHHDHEYVKPENRRPSAPAKVPVACPHCEAPTEAECVCQKIPATPAVAPSAEVMERAREFLAKLYGYKSLADMLNDNPDVSADEKLVLALVTRESNAARLAFAEKVCEQLERDCGTAIDALSDKLPEAAMKNAARSRLSLWKSNIRALAAGKEPQT